MRLAHSHRFLVILYAFSIAWPIGIGKLPARTARPSRQSAENQKPCLRFDRPPVCIRLARVEKVLAQTKAATAELAAIECGRPRRDAHGPKQANGTGPSRPLSPKNAPPSTLAKARTERVERRTSESGDLQNPAPADCPDIHISH